MKKINIAILSLALLGSSLSSCDDRLDLQNPNSPTTDLFGNTIQDLEEAILACYNHIRIEGTFARVGYTLDAVRGDEVWNSSQIWYIPYDNYEANADNEIAAWIYRDWYYTIKPCNFVLSKLTADNDQLTEPERRIKGQALFLRGLSYYMLATYFQNVPLLLDYSMYATYDGINIPANTQDEVLDQAELDLKEAMQLLPKRDEGGEWALGRATCGSAAGFYAKALMFRQKYKEAQPVLEDIIDNKYGTYKLMANYGDNFKEGTFENNDETLFEVQYLDFGKGGSTDEWTPVNLTKDPTQQHAIESNYGPQQFGSWGDLSASPWLYNLFKQEKTVDGKLDPRLYWTLATYEPEYENTSETPNEIYGTKVWYTYPTNNANGGIPIAKYTYARLGITDKIVQGLRCGINVRVIRLSDILLLAAECENENQGVTDKAIGFINQVRQRAKLAPLSASQFANADELFEQIANVERPKELGCEYGRGVDLIRWGFFYDKSRRDQLAMHTSYRKTPKRFYTEPKGNKILANYDWEKLSDTTEIKQQLTDKKIEEHVTPRFDYVTSESDKSITDWQYPKDFDCSMKHWINGHEYFPIFINDMNNNPQLEGNCSNFNTDNSSAFLAKYKVHPVPGK
ncbi:MAG: RagB/SusD family nutrient uptake outer membrane protein [Bacteroidales bacterium]|nr:RagB/SusD family nutrient uptake outer membrane protein [Bacteroidales bacterium]